MSWWEGFFDAEYIRLWSGAITPERTEREAAALWSLLDLHEGSRVLDAPCGYGRIARALAQRGAHVVGVDQAADQIAAADGTRGELSTELLRYRRHDLRQPLDETGFDVALNIFSSLGYGTEDDDLAILATLAAAVRPGGVVVVESNHRDNLVARLARGGGLGSRDPDGTLMIEEPRFDAVRGRVETCWYWSGPSGSGKKAASIRVYAIPELVGLIERAGLRVRSVHRGLAPQLYDVETTVGTRVAVIATRL